MTRLTARDFAPEVMDLFDHYVHGRLDRRGFLEGAARHATGAVTALMLLEALNPNFAMAQQVKPDDRRLDARFVEIDSPTGNGKARGYLVRPKGATGKLALIRSRDCGPSAPDIGRSLGRLTTARPHRVKGRSRRFARRESHHRRPCPPVPAAPAAPGGRPLRR